MNSSDPSGTSSTERRVARHLGNNAQMLTVGDTPVSDVIKRGKQRRARRRAGVGVLSVATVTTGAIVSVNLLAEPAGHNRLSTKYGGNTDGSTVETDVAVTDVAVTEVVSDAGTIAPDGTVSENAAPSADSQAAVARLTAIPSNLVWNAVIPNSSEALVNAGFGQTKSPPYIAVSSSPGVAAPNEYKPTLYTSDDGISWKPLDGNPSLGLMSFDSYDGALYSFSTAALTGAIEPGGAGDVVVQTSNDGGVTWDPQLLPLDLRSLVDERGVQSVPFNYRSVSAGPAGVIAVGQLAVQLDLAELDVPDAEHSNVSRVTADGIDVTTSGCVAGNFTGTVTTAPPPTVVEETIAEEVDGVTNSSVPAATPMPRCEGGPPVTIAPTNASVPAPDPNTNIWTNSYTWSDLGLSQAVIDAMVAPNHVFIKPAGMDNFTEVAIPAAPDGMKVVGATPVAMSDGYAVVAMLAPDDFSSVSATSRLYRSVDGTVWSDVELPVSNLNSFGQLADGSLVGAGWSNTGRPTVVVSADGVSWTSTDVGGLVTESDGASANLQIMTTAIGASGITMVGQIVLDPWREGGPTTISKDGVTISMINQNGDLTFTDDSSGDEIGRFSNSPPGTNPTDMKTSRDPVTGAIEFLADDGTVRLTVSGEDLNSLYQQANERNPMKALVLHSDDGINWSRENVSDIAGFPVRWVNRVQAAGDKVLVTVLDASTLNDLGKPTTVVLVGTPKS